MEHTGEERRETDGGRRMEQTVRKGERKKDREGLTGPYNGSNATDERQDQQDKEEKDHLKTVNSTLEGRKAAKQKVEIVHIKRK